MKQNQILLLAGILFISVFFPQCQWSNVSASDRLSHEEVRRLAEEIVADMTLEEKVGQIIHVGMKGKNLDRTILQDLQKHYAGGVILFGHNVGTTEEVQKLNEQLQKTAVTASGIPLFISIDQEGGRVVRIRETIEQFPGAMALGQTGNPDLSHFAGFITAYELMELGVNMVLAPVLDVNNNPENPVINTRAFGSDVETVASMGPAHAAGIREAYSVPVAKHFPGHGNTNTDSHYALPTIERSIEELEEVELVPFRQAINQGIEVIMTAHILFPELDSENPATLSPRILREILRQGLGYDGLIMSDAMEMDAISKRYSPEQSARMAFEAGVDIILLTGGENFARRMFAELLQGFESGKLSESDLDISVTRQIELKIRRGLFYKHYSSRYHELLDSAGMHDIFADVFLEVSERYREIKDLHEGTLLSEVISDQSIVSHGKEYPGTGVVPDSNIFVLYRNNATFEAFLEHGVPAGNMRRFNSAAEIPIRSRMLPENSVWVVELRESDLRTWHSVIENRAFFTVGFYSGNPFLNIAVPENGGTLLSFSHTDASRRAMVRQFMTGEAIREANLLTNIDTEAIEGLEDH